MNNDNGAGSVTNWIRDLENSDPDAQQKIWERFVNRLVNFANYQLKGMTVVADGNDIANMAFANFFKKTPDQFDKLVDRNDLWQILAMFAKRRAIDQIRREARDRDNLVNGVEEVDGIANSNGSPDFDVMLLEEFEMRLSSLDDDVLQRIAVDRMQGYGNREIATRLEIGLRSVERKLSQIRTIFESAGRKPGPSQ